jgi:5S rRNA maturation endonuclease (ribonuclease M5)
MKAKIFDLWDNEEKRILQVKASRSGKEWKALCPKHEDHEPSLAISEEKGVFYCHGCGWKGRLANKGTKPKVKEVYDYRDESGNLVFQILRYEPKNFKARRMGKNRRWVYNLDGVEPVPYRLPELLGSDDNRVFITEGEKDCDNLRALGFTATTAPFGAKKWRNEYNKFLARREVIILPDNDTPGIEHAVMIAKALEGIAKDVKILNPQSLNLDEHQDITDWITRGGTREMLLRILSDQKNFLDLRNEERAIRIKKYDELLKAGFHREELPEAQSYRDGILTYGVKWGQKRILIRSDHTLEETTQGSFTHSVLTPAIVSRFLNGDPVESDFILRLRDFIKERVFFKNEKIPLFLAVWIVGTYLYKVFCHYGYLWIVSPTPQCGKTLLLEVISQFCFNSTQRLTNPSPSSIFREITQNNSTLIWDECDNLKKEDREDFSQLNSMLNSGFQRGSVVLRTEKVNGRFEINRYEVYSPKVLCGLNQVPGTIRDRAFRITMVKKKESEKIKRFVLQRDLEQIEQIRSNLYLWALSYCKDVEKVYHQLPDLNIPHISKLTDRERDIWEPILAISLVLEKTTEINGISDQLVTLASEMSEKKSQEMNAIISPFISLIKDKFFGDNQSEVFVPTAELFGLVKQDERLRDVLTSEKKMANLIQSLEPDPPYPTKKGGKRGYFFKREWVEDIIERYISL